MFERNSNTIQHMTATSLSGGGGTVGLAYDSFPMPENAKPNVTWTTPEHKTLHCKEHRYTT